MNVLHKLLHTLGWRRERRSQPRGTLRHQMEVTDAILFHAIDQMEHEAETTTRILRARRQANHKR